MSMKNLEQLAADERREYMRKWRAANREKVKKHNADYWRRRAERKAQEGEGK